MRTRKPKRLIAFALSVLMILTMLPVSAFAAADTHDHTATGSTATVSINLTALSENDFGHTYTRASGNPQTQEVKNTKTYNSLLRPFFAPSASSDTSKLDGYIAEASAVFNTTKAKKELTVSTDEIFLVAAQVKLDKANMGDYKGIILYNLVLKYDPTKLEYIGKSDTDWPASINMAMVRGVNLDTENDPPAPDSEGMDYYASGLTAQTSGNINTAADGTAYIQVGVANSRPNYLPKNQPWDILFPFKAKSKTADGAPATIEVETGIYTISGNDYEGMFRIGKDSNDVSNGDNGLDWSTGQSDELSIGGSAGPAHLSTSNVAITVTSNNASVSIPANTKKAKTTDRTLDVTVDSKGNFKDGGTFKILESSDGTNFTDSSIAVSSVTVSSNKKTATLTFDGTNLDKAKTYKIQVSSDAVDAVSPATVPATMLTGTFTACDPLGGTPGTDGTAYGDTIKATLTGENSTNLTYSWSVGDTYNTSAHYSTNATGVTPATYMAAQGFALGTSKMTFRITATDLDNTYLDVTTSAIAKKSINLPTTITGVPAVAQGSTGDDLKVTGSYDFPASSLVSGDKVTVAYTGTYADATTAPSTPSNVAIAWGAVTGTNSDRYTIANKDSVTTTGTGSVTKAGYALTADGVTFTSGGTASSGKYEVAPAGATVTGTVDLSALAAGETLTNVTVSGSGFTTQTLTEGSGITTSGNTATFTFTLAQTTKAYELTVKANTSQGAIPVTVTVTKDYDGTNAIALADIEIKANGSTVAGVDAAAFGIEATTLTFADADAAANKTITLPSGLAEKEIEVNDQEYKFPASLTGEITAHAATKVTAVVEGLKEGATADEIATAILAAKIMVDDIDSQTTIAENGVTKDAVLEALEAAKIDGNDIFDEGDPATSEDIASDASVAKTPAHIGDKYVLTGEITLPDPAVGLEAAYDSATGKTTVTVTGEVTADVVIDLTPANNSDDITLTVKTAAPVEPTEDTWNIVPGTLALEDLAVTPAGKLATNFSGVTTVDVSAEISNKSSGSGILYNTNGYAVAGMDEVEVDEENKITSLTEVTDIVKGATFLGWSTDGTKEHIVKVGYQFKENELEKGLTAVFEGYMMGRTPTTAAPTGKVKRAELLKMVLVASGKFDATKDYDYSKTEGFKDVKKDSTAWYVPYLACNLELPEDQRIIKGYEDGTFRPEKTVTREEAAAIIARAFGVKTTEGATTSKITDLNKVQSWARDYVVALCDNGTISGFPDGTFRGGNTANRDAAAKMVNPYLGLTDADRKTILEDTKLTSPFTDVTKGNWAYADLMFASLSVPSDYYQTEITIPGAAPAAPETPAE